MKVFVTMRFGQLICLGVLVFLVACSASRPKPVEIPPIAVLQEVRTAWTAQIGKVHFPLSIATRNDRIAVASSDGTVAMLNAKSGKDIWRSTLPKTTVSAGVGSDGLQVALVTRDNQLVVMQDAKVQWRQTLPAQSFTAPLVAGQRVFVLTADRSVLAFDGSTGQRLWTQQRLGEPLVLKQAGVLVAFKNTLLVGLSGRLVGLDPTNGLVVWESAIATPRGTNDMERLVDLVGPSEREGDMVCVRAFQSQVGCVNAQKGQGMWTRPSVGDKGLSGNLNLVIAPQANGVVQALRREDGERVWETERLKYRQLSAPLVTPKGILMADGGGWVYVLSLADGALLNRLKIGTEELAAAPTLAQDVSVLVSREGRVTGLLLP